MKENPFIFLDQKVPENPLYFSGAGEGGYGVTPLPLFFQQIQHCSKIAFCQINPPTTVHSTNEEKKYVMLRPPPPLPTPHC